LYLIAFLFVFKSGDGTIRKNPTVWKDWTPGSGNSRHFVQFNLVERGVELLKVGGIIAYSSCAINPVENEAVLARLIRQSGGALELVDCRDCLPGERIIFMLLYSFLSIS
jgi:16S rRNA C967 or C1407 C5-methylase (RsmB/RsmF family)